VAKRRNLKKEKAARNQAYARQFRKTTSRFGGKNNRGFGRNRQQTAESDTNEEG
jgi:hypothetical protein